MPRLFHKPSPAKILELALGSGILWLFLFLGVRLKHLLHLILPGNVLGLFLLLAAISLKIVKIRHIELASKWLLFFMPLLFVPIYAGAAADKKIWIDWGWLLVPTLVTAVIVMWIAVGHLAQWIHRSAEKTGEEPSP